MRGIELAIDRWQAAVEIRAEWAGFGLSTTHADRGAAEAAISELYGLIGRAAPRFVWADSPQQATELLPADLPRLQMRADKPFDET